ncbi:MULTISPECIES: purine-nucleoside phosphorylase [Flaviflexus]|uniref:Purine nucleoside phosphorylase n=1 Tax=Flaviflexus ciconiae TaxID=2496867 RepID=A0A3Q9G6M7_9ACTO|nr:purine-nucleoside phosphorylase [Flaviflexus ciconiae]AZQ76893.1 purine-nucleoside phosphorylase [Flaviflexus ciconiae]
MTTQDPYTLASSAAEYIAAAAGIEAIDIALVLGSGWKGAEDLLGDAVVTLPAEDVPGFTASAVVGHGGTLTVRKLASGAHALILGARTHLYEGLGVAAVAHGVRTSAKLGAKALILTNGCGSTVPEWGPGTAVLLKDHLNLTGTSPIVGANFVDLTDAYSPRLREIAHRVDPNLPEGVYAQFPGPHYETPAEVKMARLLGADLVGMSTTLETIAAREAGLEVLGISLVTNQAAGFAPAPLSHEEVLQAGAEAGPRLATLLADIVKEMSA